MADRLTTSICFLFLAFVGSSCLHLRQRRETCDDKDLEKCVMALSMTMTSATGIDVELFDTREKLNRLCTMFDNALDCVANSTEKCEVEQMMQITIDTVSGSIEYICSEEGSRILLEEFSCLEDPALEDNIKECFEETIKLASDENDVCGEGEEIGAALVVQAAGKVEVSATSLSSDSKIMELSSIIQDVISCARASTEDLCGQQAATFVGRVMHELVKPYASAMLDCNLQLRAVRDLLSKFSFKRK